MTYPSPSGIPDNREKYMGDPDVWNETEQDIRNILDELGDPYVGRRGQSGFLRTKGGYQRQERVRQREDTMITIQWDALLAEQFDMYYIDQNGEKVARTSSTEPPWDAMSVHWHG